MELGIGIDFEIVFFVDKTNKTGYIGLALAFLGRFPKWPFHGISSFQKGANLLLTYREDWLSISKTPPISAIGYNTGNDGEVPNIGEYT
jgi:hypothetical protein